MQVNHQRCWSFALSGARQYAPETSTKSGVLRRTLRHLGGQTIVSAFVLIDIGGLGFALVASIWLAPWVAINLTALVLGSLSWSEDRRIQRESATAIRRQLQREAERQQQARYLREAEEIREAERRQREEEDERKAQKSLQAALRQAQEQLREAEQRRYQEEKERETQRRQSEQAERRRQAEQQRREADQRRRQAEEEREAQRKRRREQKRVAAQFKSDWWIVLGVAPSASKDEIVRK